MGPTVFDWRKHIWISVARSLAARCQSRFVFNGHNCSKASSIISGTSCENSLFSPIWKMACFYLWYSLWLPPGNVMQKQSSRGNLIHPWLWVSNCVAMCKLRQRKTLNHSFQNPGMVLHQMGEGKLAEDHLWAINPSPRLNRFSCRINSVTCIFVRQHLLSVDGSNFSRRRRSLSVNRLNNWNVS